MTMSEARWYVVQTHVHAETKAAAHLVRQSYSIYLPRYLKRRRHARRVEMIAAPLFPRYLFVAIDRTTQRWRSILSTVGVTQLVRQGEEPGAVPRGVVEALRRREDERGLIKLDLRPRLVPGAKVREVDGVFSKQSQSVCLCDGLDTRKILLETERWPPVWRATAKIK